jgi:DNA-directed RNA polymerase sigma subunit (sigma70/sigma32)
MFKALDHRPIVKRQLTFVNTEVLRLELTSCEVGQHFAVTRERIRQIEAEELRAAGRSLKICAPLLARQAAGLGF